MFEKANIACGKVSAPITDDQGKLQVTCSGVSSSRE